MNSSRHAPPASIDDAIRKAAAHWIVRRDRGFSETEAVEFKRWLAADARHPAAIARSADAWALLDRVPAFEVPPAVSRGARLVAWRWPALGGLAAAAAVTIATSLMFNGERTPESTAKTETGPAATRPVARPVTQIAPDTQVLPDGTLVRLNAGAELTPAFSSEERRVRLVRGEAYFSVAKDPRRAFIVEAGGATVRAVGTAFNVHLKSERVDVLVAEGSVRVASPRKAASDGAGILPPPDAGEATPESPLVTAGQRAVVALTNASPTSEVVISDLAPDEMAEVLARRERLLKLAGATLAELAVRFEQESGTRLVLADPSLSTIRIGGRFRGHDVEGFVRVLKNTYGIRSERGPDGSIVLTRGP